MLNLACCSQDSIILKVILFPANRCNSFAHRSALEIEVVLFAVYGSPPNDNTLAVNMETVNKYAVENGTKVFTSDGSMCKRGGLVSYGVDYYEIGVEAADMAYEILVYGNMEYDEE